jgi:gamma-glutamylputrescine oxidase
MGRWQDRFDDNRSVWLADKEPYVPSAPLRTDSSVDVAIIGGGFTGISTAYRLAQRFPDKRIALLEAMTLANGASGRNGGQMLNWVNGVETGDPEEAKRIYETTREAIDDIIALIVDNQLDVTYRRDGHFDIFTNPRTAEAAERETEVLRRLGLPVRFLGPEALREQLAVEGACGAIFDPEGGQLDGLAFVRAMRPVVESHGVTICEATPVLRIREGSTIELETPEATVRAKAIVVATNAYTPHLGYFRSGIVPIHAHVIATGAASSEEWATRGWRRGSAFSDDRDRLSYGTLSASGRLLFGGGSNGAYDYRFGNRTRFIGSSERASEACRRQLLAYLPGLRDVPIEHRWSGPVALTMSRLCAMGVRGADRNVYFALGYSGHGMTLANLSGKVLCDIYSDSDERWRPFPFYRRDLGYVPPEPFRWIGYHLYTRLTGRSPRRRSTR